MNRIARLRAKARRLPLLPGVYLMRNAAGEIIYVGKAKALKNRVSGYFTGAHEGKVLKMVSLVEDFDTIVCDNEFEALILECSLIKQHKPKYNILLKDDKGYHYIRVTKPPWRRLSAAKQIFEDSDMIGPYNSGYIVTQTVEEACKVFRLPTCNRPFSDRPNNVRPCLRHFMGLCSAPCAGKIDREAYEESVSEALDYIKSGSALSVERLTQKMEEAAENLQFEKAAVLRDRIRAIRRFGEKQKVVDSAVPHQDVVAAVSGPKLTCFQVLRFKNRKLCDSEFFLVPAPENPERARYEFLMSYYAEREDIPPLVSLDEPAEDMDLLSRWLGERLGRKVKIFVPQKGDCARIVKMCKNNAAEHLAQNTGRTGRETAALDELGRLLGLSRPPAVIEAYDISHTGGNESVAGLVLFRDGRADRSRYRKFKIKTAAGGDDYAAMKEVLSRRLEEYRSGSEDATFGELPDLILVDGGKGQVRAAEEALREKGLSVPVFGMVKDSKHKTRAVTSAGEEIAVKSTRSVYTLISTMQEEVHRFSVEYHRNRRKKRTFSSSLTGIEGIGESRARNLLKHFGTLAAVRAAGIDDLARVKGMNKTAAEKVWMAFHGSPAEKTEPAPEKAAPEGEILPNG